MLKGKQLLNATRLSAEEINSRFLEIFTKNGSTDAT
jgi:hypothetical protein